jgi:hypothetical protein
MIHRQYARRTAIVRHRSRGFGVCQHCRHVIRFYRDVGWVDTTPPFYGGSYDMCAASVTGQHDPQPFNLEERTLCPVGGHRSRGA